MAITAFREIRARAEVTAREAQDAAARFRAHRPAQRREVGAVGGQLERELADEGRRDRIAHRVRVRAAAFLVVAALYGFLRADAWTKGYLTGGLAIAAAAAAGGGVALLFLMR